MDTSPWNHGPADIAEKYHKAKIKVNMIYY